MCPLPDALDATVGYFDDEKVALVQSPHDFYNQDSVQHYEVGRHEQSMFFEVVCPGKDRHNGVYWCGSAAILRRAALVEVGGVATETIAEDFHTTIKMHRAGWTTHYHDEILVQGLAPLDLDGYLLQRDRWARGNLAVFRLPESPLRLRSKLGPRQRFSYFGSLFAYGAGVSRLAMIGLLVAVLVGGVLPARMTLLSLAVLWAALDDPRGHLCHGALPGPPPYWRILSLHARHRRDLHPSAAMRAVPVEDEVQGHSEVRRRRRRPPFTWAPQARDCLRHCSCRLGSSGGRWESSVTCTHGRFPRGQRRLR